MSWWLGAGLGFLRGGPLGAVIGGAIQHTISKKVLRKADCSLPGVNDPGVFATCLIAILTRANMTGGTLAVSQIAVIHNFFRKNFSHGFKELKFVDEVVRETNKWKPDLLPLVKQFKKSCAGKYNLLLLALAYQVALSGNSIHENVTESLLDLAKYLGISYERHDGLREKYSLPPLVTPFTVLGISYSADDDTIRKAYRQKAGEFHPDRVAHLGEHRTEEAHMKFLEVQEAYKELEKSRGL
jgi:DnaJ like chaperone protein